jgi:hypothetical protein
MPPNDIIRHPPARVRSMPAKNLVHAVASRRQRAAWFLLAAFAANPAWSADASLPSSPESYVSQAEGVRRANDRPWVPDAGKLGNLRHLQIAADDCVVRVVSGTENRVFPGTREVTVVERSRVLDSDPNEQPAPRDVALATDIGHVCSGLGSCGVSITPVTRAPRAGGSSNVCFTVQLATAHDLLAGGDGLTLMLDRIRQPALRIALNPSTRLRVWLEQVDLGLLSIDANASVRVGGNGKVDFLRAGSSNGGSVMTLHEFRARNVDVMTTTTGTQWSIRIDADSRASYYQPAAASGRIAEKNYRIEIDGAIARLQVPAGGVSAHPLSASMRSAARTLHDEVLASAGAAPTLPASEPGLPSASTAAATLPREPRERVAQVVARHVPASVKITAITLWKQGGRLEFSAPDDATATTAVRRLKSSGEFIHFGAGGASPRDGAFHISGQMHFSCDTPGQSSICPPGDPRKRGAYSEAQVSRELRAMLGPDITVHDIFLDRGEIALEAQAATEAEAIAAIERIRQPNGLFRLSVSGYGPTKNGSTTDIHGKLNLVCAVPPKPDSICAAQTVAMPDAGTNSK